jgi:thymidylate synthase
VFGYQMRFDLRTGFPAITTKKLAWKAVVSELLWFLEGSGDERRLAEILHGTRDISKTTIWTANAKADYWLPKAHYEGDLGRVYGVQWRDFMGVDQVQQLIDGIKNDPSGRRHILSAWNPAELSEMALPPCHVMSQFDVTDGYLSCQMYQRSCDMFLGVPFNIASYSLLTHIIARECGLKVGDFVWTGGDCHIYSNHVDAVNEQLAREERALPTLMFTVNKKWNEYVLEDFVLDGYDPHPAIKAEMAV